MSNIKEETIQQLMEQFIECNKKYEIAKHALYHFFPDAVD